MTKRILTLDLLRVLAFLFVALHHCAWWFLDKYGQSNVISNFLLGDIGVSFFIILSGLGLTLSNSNTSFTSDKKTFFRHFYLKRALSIYPSYWIAYIVISLLLLVLFSEYYPQFSWTKFLLTITAMDGWYLLRYESFYRVGEWFTGFILLVYIICPPILLYIKRRPALVVLLTFIISFITIVFFDSVKLALPEVLIHPVAWCNPTSRLFEFALGGLIATLFISGNSKFSYSNNLKLYLFIFCLICWIFLYFLKYFWLGYPQSVYMLRSIFLCCLAFMMAFFIIEKLEYMITANFSSIVVKLSKLSFLAFLYHHVIILKVISMLNDGGKIHPYTYFSFLFFVVLCFSFIFAWITYPLIDKLTRLIKRTIQV